MKISRYWKRILTLFLLSTLTPVVVISLVFLVFTEATVNNISHSRLQSELNTFASQVALIIDNCARELSVLSSDTAILAAIRSPIKPDPILNARALRHILSAFPRNTSNAEACILSCDGLTSLRIGSEPNYRNLNIYSNWGIFRLLKNSNLSVIPSSETLSDGSKSMFTVGVAIRTRSGSLSGYALADIKREAISKVAQENSLYNEILIVSDSGKIAYCQSDSSKEGKYIDINFEKLPVNYLQAKVVSAGNEFSIIIEDPPNQNLDYVLTIRKIAIFGLLFSLVFVVLLSFKSSQYVTKPVLEMSETIKKIIAGDLTVKAKPLHDDELGDLANSLNIMTERFDKLLKDLVERQELLRESELKALASQMNPHFLNNTLASIKSLAKLGNNQEVVKVVTKLGKILRTGIYKKTGKTTIGESISITSDYLTIEKIRFGDRFNFYINIDPLLNDVQILPLCLESIAENSLTHGLEKKSGKGHLVINGKREGKDAVIEFIDDGPGIEYNKFIDLQAALEEYKAPKETDGMGLMGTNRRLFLEYGIGYGLSIQKNQDAGITVSIRIPMKEQNETFINC